jgi:hypothetical protein
MKKFLLFLAICFGFVFVTKAQVLTPSSTSICSGDSVMFTVSNVSDTDTVVYYTITDSITVDTVIGPTFTVNPTVSSTYSLLTVNDSIISTMPVVIQVNNLPVISLYYERVSCNTFAIHYDIFSGYLPVTYSWNNGVDNMTNIINGGDTTVIYLTDHNGCMVTDTISVPVDTFVVIDSVWSNPETCNLGLAGFHAAGGNITYTWADSSHAQVRNLCHGTYHVIASNQYGCTADTDIMVGIVQNPIAIIPTYTPITSYGDSTSLSVIAVYGTAPYTYQWNNGSADSVQFVGAGSYFCVVTDANGCSDTTITVNITQPSNLSVYVDIPVVHCSDQSVQIVPVVSGGQQPYSYTWNGVAVVPPISITTSGNYILVVTDANGLSQTVAVPIQFPVLITATINASATQVTAGTPVTLTAGQADEYIWSTGATTQSIVVTPTETSNYWLYVSNNSGCSDVTSITIVVTGGDNPGGGGGSITGNQLSFELGDMHNVCWNGDPIVLQNYVNVSPYNGGQVNFVGPGVAGGVFYPSAVGMVGTYQIIASYDDPVLNTHSTATQSITVNPSTTLDWHLQQYTVGLNDPPFRLEGGIPAGGIYSGPGVVQQGDDYYFYPSSAGLGVHMLYYEYTNVFGCYSNTSKALNVVYSTSVSEHQSKGISVYPNPTTDNVVLDLSEYTYDVVLVDMLGRTLSSFENLTGSNEIELSNLSNGIYFLRCTSESGDIITKKVVKK